MRKLALDVDELVVESFETARTFEARGTVHGHSGWQCTEYNPTCDGCNTQNDGGCITAGDTCGVTCGYTCGCGTGGGNQTIELTCAPEFCM